MTARQRIEQLMHTWYGFTVFAAVASVVQAALWPFAPGLMFSPVRLALALVGSALAVTVAIGFSVVTGVFGVLVVAMLGRALLARSSVTRLLLLGLSPLLAVLSGVSALQQLWSGVSHFSLSPLIAAAVSTIAATLYVRSFRVLIDPSVKDYTR